jgi:hypothetical protein
MELFWILCALTFPIALGVRARIDTSSSVGMIPREANAALPV